MILFKVCPHDSTSLFYPDKRVVVVSLNMIKAATIIKSHELKGEVSILWIDQSKNRRFRNHCLLFWFYRNIQRAHLTISWQALDLQPTPPGFNRKHCPRPRAHAYNQFAFHLNFRSVSLIGKSFMLAKRFCI